MDKKFSIYCCKVQKCHVLKPRTHYVERGEGTCMHVCKTMNIPLKAPMVQIDASVLVHISSVTAQTTCLQCHEVHQTQCTCRQINMST